MDCIYCKTPLKGRIDKIYCDAYCKSAHFYNKKKEDGKISFFAKVDKHLKTNRKILKYYNKDGYTVIRKDRLTQKGFNPEFFTHYWKNRNGNIYLFCYEFGFLSIKKSNPKKYLLVSWKKYMVN